MSGARRSSGRKRKVVSYVDVDDKADDIDDGDVVKPEIKEEDKSDPEDEEYKPATNDNDERKSEEDVEERCSPAKKPHGANNKIIEVMKPCGANNKIIEYIQLDKARFLRKISGDKGDEEDEEEDEGDKGDEDDEGDEGGEGDEEDEEEDECGVEEEDSVGNEEKEETQEDDEEENDVEEIQATGISKETGSSSKVDVNSSCWVDENVSPAKKYPRRLSRKPDEVLLHSPRKSDEDSCELPPVAFLTPLGNQNANTLKSPKTPVVKNAFSMLLSSPQNPSTPISSKKTTPAANSKGKKSAASSGQPKTPAAKKTALSCYQKENREAVKKANKGKPTGEITKLLSAQWKELSFVDRKSYLEMAQEDEKRHSQEMDTYNDELKVWNTAEKKKKDEAEAKVENAECYDQAKQLQKAPFDELLAFVKESRKAQHKLEKIKNNVEQRKATDLFQVASQKMQVPLRADNILKAARKEIRSQIVYRNGLKYRPGVIRCEFPNTDADVIEYLFHGDLEIRDPEDFFGVQLRKSLRYGSSMFIAGPLSVKYTAKSQHLTITGAYTMS